jgi:hypothetical protein
VILENMDAKGGLLTFISNGIKFKSKIDYGVFLGPIKLNVAVTVVSIKKILLCPILLGCN